jgi:hypothetical protein
MIGDDEFDVIVLEYYMMAGDGLALLARRLRERFPDAIIVILRLWAPDRIWRNGDGSQKVHNWASQNGFGGGFIHDEEFKKEHKIFYLVHLHILSCNEGCLQYTHHTYTYCLILETNCSLQFYHSPHLRIVRISLL